MSVIEFLFIQPEYLKVNFLLKLIPLLVIMKCIGQIAAGALLISVGNPKILVHQRGGLLSKHHLTGIILMPLYGATER